MSLLPAPPFVTHSYSGPLWMQPQCQRLCSGGNLCEDRQCITYLAMLWWCFAHTFSDCDAILLLCFVFAMCAVAWGGISLPRPRLFTRLQQWKHWILTIRPPRNFPCSFFFFQYKPLILFRFHQFYTNSFECIFSCAILSHGYIHVSTTIVNIENVQ